MGIKEQLKVFDNLTMESHILIGGATGSGKSVLLNDFLYCLTRYPRNDQQLILIDLKRVELSRWRSFPQVLTSVTEPEQVVPLLDRVVDHMEWRYREMEKRCQVESEYNYLHIVIDEMAEVCRVKGALDRIDKLMRLGRAAHIHIIMATQNVSRLSGIPAYIWQNVTCTIGLRCRSAIESRQIIGVAGCEDLPRHGYCYIQNADGLFLQEIPYIPNIHEKSLSL